MHFYYKKNTDQDTFCAMLIMCIFVKNIPKN